VSVHDETADAQYWYLFDALGSTMGLVDANGDLSGKLQYDAFGTVLAEENVPRSALFKYVGAYQYMPEEFEDMLLLWHRWYDPTVGRFVGKDAEEDGGPGLYAYPDAGTDPVGDADPSGLSSDGTSWTDYFWDVGYDYYVGEPLGMQMDPNYSFSDCFRCCMREHYASPWAGLPVIPVPKPVADALRPPQTWPSGKAFLKDPAHLPRLWYRHLIRVLNRRRPPGRQLDPLRGVEFLRKMWPYLVIAATYSLGSVGSCIGRCAGRKGSFVTYM